MPSPSNRADVFLVDHGYARSRTEAQEAIVAGKVFADGRRIIKASQSLNETSRIKYERAHPYVSRGAIKLAGALNHFGLEPYEKIVLDIGASTGGFTEVLLLRGASKVYAVDVGHGQLDAKLATDLRVVSLERTDARTLTRKLIPKAPQAVVADVSFISLQLALPRALKLAADGAWLVALIKPQFEVGKAHVGKGGIVRDETAALAARDEISRWLIEDQGWSVLGTMESTITGGDGNREYFVAATKQ